MTPLPLPHVRVFIASVDPLRTLVLCTGACSLTARAYAATLLGPVSDPDEDTYYAWACAASVHVHGACVSVKWKRPNRCCSRRLLSCLHPVHYNRVKGLPERTAPAPDHCSNSFQF